MGRKVLEFPGEPAAARAEDAVPLGATWLAAAGYSCLFASGFADNTRGPLLPHLQRTFELSDSWTSLLLWVGSLAGLPGSFLTGSLIARIGPRATLRLMAALLSIGLGLIALAGAQGRLVLVPVGAGVLGFGLGGVGVCANYYVALATPMAGRARSLARLHVTYAVASILVPLLVGRAAETLPWPWVIAFAALVPAALLPFSLLVPRSDPVPLARQRLEEPLRLRTIIPYGIALSLFVVAEVSISAWLSLYAERTTTYSSAVRPLLLAGFFLGLGTARLLGGTLLRPEHGRHAIVGAALATAAAGLLGLHVSALFLSAAGLGAGLLFPATLSALTLALPRAQHGMAIALVSGGYSLALALSHGAVGHLSDRFGIGAALHMSPIAALLGVLVLGGLAWR